MYERKNLGWGGGSMKAKTGGSMIVDHGVDIAGNYGCTPYTDLMNTTRLYKLDIYSKLLHFTSS